MRYSWRVAGSRANDSPEATLTRVTRTVNRFCHAPRIIPTRTSETTWYAPLIANHVHGFGLFGSKTASVAVTTSA